MKDEASGPAREAWALFAALALLYFRLRCPSFGPGDSAQHALSAMTWGVSRPPGYPLYTAAAWLFARLGLSWVSAFSGVAQAAAAGGLYFVWRRQGCGVPAALSAIGLTFLSPLMWFYAEVPEVRGLNNAIAAAAAIAALAWCSRARMAEVWLGLALGLGLSHHPTFLFIVPSVLLLASDRRPTREEAVRALASAAAGLALPYLILWARLMIGPPPQYNPDGVSGIGGVLGLFLRRGTGGLLSVSGGAGTGFSPARFATQLRWCVATWSKALTPGGLILAALGAFALRGRPRQLAAWLAWAALPALAYAALAAAGRPVEDPEYAAAIAARFHLLPLLGVAALAAQGVQLLAGAIRERFLWGLALAAFGIALMRPVDLRRHEPTRRYADDLIAATGPGDAVFLDSDDAVAALWYADAVEHRRGERAFISLAMIDYRPYAAWLARAQPDLVVPRGADGKASRRFADWLRANPARAFWAEGTLRPLVDKQLPKAYADGPLLRLSLDGKGRPAAEDSARRFLSSSLGSLDRKELMADTQEIFLTRAGMALAHWYLNAVKASPANLELQSQLAARMESYW